MFYILTLGQRSLILIGCRYHSYKRSPTQRPVPHGLGGLSDSPTQRTDAGNVRKRNPSLSRGVSGRRARYDRYIGLYTDHCESAFSNY